MNKSGNLKRCVAFLAALLILLGSIPTNRYGIVAQSDTTDPVKKPDQVETSDNANNDKKDMESPNLNIDIPDLDQWINNIESWTVSCDEIEGESVSIYYKTSDKLPKNWGNYNDADSVEWKNNIVPPEGEYYIKFWAVSNNQNRKINDYEDVYRYKIDTTEPEKFSFSYIQEDFSLINWFPSVYLNISDIIDTLSGVSKIYYTVRDDSKIYSMEEIAESPKDLIEVVSDDLNINEDSGSMSFDIKLSRSMVNNTVTVYVIDQAGNMTVQSSNKIEDVEAPQIKECNLVNISDIDSEKEIKNNLVYGNNEIEEAPKRQFYYLGDESCLSLTVVDDNIEKIVINIGDGNKEFELSDSDITKDSKEYKKLSVKRESNENSSDISKYVIPISYIANKLQWKQSDDTNVYNLKIIAKDIANNMSKESEIKNLFYDPNSTDNDVKINVKLNENYSKKSSDVWKDSANNSDIDICFFGSDNDSNSVEINLSDDVGVSNYKVSLIESGIDTDTELINIVNDVSKGKTVKYVYSTDTDIDSDGKKINTDIDKEIEYQERIRTVDIDPIYLQNDGIYTVNVSAEDLAGNKRNLRQRYLVDTTAPIIEDLKYSSDNSLIYYLSFGLFGKNNINLQIKVSDGENGVGVEKESIILQWNEKNYVANNIEKKSDGVWYSFDLETDDMKDKDIDALRPTFIVSDRLGNINTYYITVNNDTDENANHNKAVEIETDQMVVDKKSGLSLILEKEKPIVKVSYQGNNVSDSLEEHEQELYFGDSEDSVLCFEISDNTGIEKYDINICDTKNHKIEDKSISKSFTDNALTTYDMAKIAVDDLESGKYNVTVDAYDLAGNKNEILESSGFIPETFYIDKTAPVIDELKYSQDKSLIYYLTFGLFGNSPITFSVKVSDGENGVGIGRESIVLQWGEESYIANRVETNSDETWYSFDLETGDMKDKDIEILRPTFIVTDRLGNSNTYGITLKDNVNNEEKVGKYQLDIINLPSETSGLSLKLENKVPIVKVRYQGENTSAELDEHKQQLYFGDMSIVTEIENAVDSSLFFDFSDDTGLGKYDINIKDESGQDVKDKNISRFFTGDIISKSDTAQIIVDDLKSGKYTVSVDAEDLAGNKNKGIQSEGFVADTFYVDKAAPVIEELEYKENNSLIHYLSFGLFGKSDITFKIKVTDGEYGSGVPTESIVLIWNSNKYIAELEGEWYTFKLDTADFSDKNIESIKPIFTVTDRLGNSNNYYITTKGNLANEQAIGTKDLVVDKNSGLSLVLENNAPVVSVSFSGDHVSTTLPGHDGQLYFGDKSLADNLEKSVGDSNLLFDFSDDTGLGKYEINIIDLNGNPVERKTVNRSFTENDIIQNDTVQIIVDDLETGKYTIKVRVSDLAGNVTDSFESVGFVSDVFYIDKTAPIIVDTQYTVTPSILKYFTFGIFGNSNIDITVNLNDFDNGCGVNSVILNWGGEKVGKVNDANAPDTYKFEGLKPNVYDIPFIKVDDSLGNTNYYYFTATEKSNDEKNNIAIGELILDNSRGAGVSLTLENEAPDINVYIPETYKKFMVNDDVWYGDDITYHVTATDVSPNSKSKVYSGLNHVDVYEDTLGTVLNAPKYVMNSYTEQLVGGENTLPNAKNQKNIEFEHIFDKEQFNGTAEYDFNINKDGHYRITTNAFDNAGNSNSNAVEFHIDKNNPKVEHFTFGGLEDNEPFFERGTYGYFFLKETEARVYVSDAEISSGLNRVTLYLTSSADDTVSAYTLNSNSLVTDSTGTYAVYTIPIGFKGRVAADVYDNVEHTSGIINADGNIVENADIHNNTSSIEIKENKTTGKNDANNIPLYNSSIPLTIKVNDEFSGISTIEWSIANDNKSGIIEVSVDGSYRSDSADAVVIDDSIKRDSNLITSLEFAVTVENNSNGNVVKVKLTDRSGNTSETEKVYSIDTTPPSLTASLSNHNPRNSDYYNTDQTVTISITERNFDPNDVNVSVNGAEQKIEWGTTEPSVGNDETVHIASFSITKDGEYSVTVSYTDMAGNVGDSAIPDNKSYFVIDKTPPKIVNNFKFFGNDKDDMIYFNLSQKEDVEAEITVTEVNFNEEDMRVSVYYKPAGSSHSDDGWNDYYYSKKWDKSPNDNNTHILTIPFEEDGVYKITMDPVDRAGNIGDFSSGNGASDKGKYNNTTAIFETDYTKPIIVSRNNSYVDAGDTKFSDFYDYDRRLEVAPDVTFSDINIDHIDCTIRKYTPTYSNGMNIGEIKPDEHKSIVNTFVSDTNDQMRYTVSDFDLDGVYSVKLIAYDRSGNASQLNDNTYVRMVNPESKVLAYIENSDSETGEGWYSFENENGPISKQPDSFSDLNIVVFSKISEDSYILLCDKDTNVTTDTGITSNKTAVFDDSMYDVYAYRYILPGSYFSDNYDADADTHLFLQVENANIVRDIGEIYIDNTDPTCTIPEHFKNWGWISGSGNQTIVFEDVSEVLDETKTLAYVDGETIKLMDENGNKSDMFSYNDTADSRSIKLTLSPGSHSVGLMLIDKAGNEGKINEVSHLGVGNYRIWVTVSSVLSIGVLIAIIVVLSKKFKRKASSENIK